MLTRKAPHAHFKITAKGQKDGTTGYSRRAQKPGKAKTAIVYASTL